MGYAKKTLSASTDGMGIKVVQTATAGNLIHTGSNNPAVTQEVWLYAYNSNAAADAELTIEFGDATVPDHNIKVTVPFRSGLFLIIPGLILKGNATPLTVKAFASVANVITISGYVNEIS